MTNPLAALRHNVKKNLNEGGRDLPHVERTFYQYSLQFSYKTMLKLGLHTLDILEINWSSQEDSHDSGRPDVFEFIHDSLNLPQGIHAKAKEASPNHDFHPHVSLLESDFQGQNNSLRDDESHSYQTMCFCFNLSIEHLPTPILAMPLPIS
ncbi:hypothetical protein TNCT_425811 [Trichonephila clavata]|uniref:Uncharacterized protein n=1 Tax=Trichonephila clavata TaxID=2740835 RepID=A0A8X6KDJ7_TRICU|nr:hypothetical protein TNCT_425811 [Trichonephila clavata]